MELGVEQLRELSLCAMEAARKAGALINEYAQREVEVLHKEGGDSLASQVVTEVDGLAQDVILETLQPTRATYDLALLTEELEDDGSRHEKDYFWCIDPMDGTLPFTRRQPGYAVSIALVAADGTPVIGVVYDPVEDDLYEATKGLGMRINEVPFVLPAMPERAESVLRFYCDCTFEEDAEREALTAQMLNFAKTQGYADGEVILGGGAVLNACTVLQNGPAIYFKKPKAVLGGGCAWDFASSACLFLESGASVTDFYGKRLELNSKTHRFFNHCGACFSTELDLLDELAESFEL